MADEPPPEVVAHVTLGTCDGCVYWDAIEETDAEGYCRVAPPRAPTQRGALSLWPRCRATDWCGAWVAGG